jgi:hypothetical protein
VETDEQSWLSIYTNMQLNFKHSICSDVCMMLVYVIVNNFDYNYKKWRGFYSFKVMCN